MSRDDQPPQESNFVSDLRDTVGRKVSANEGSIRGRLGKAARWVDQRTGGKYSEQIGRAEAAVGEGVGRLAAQDRPAGAAAPADAGFAGSDAPTPPEGTRMPGAPDAGPGDVRDDSPTGPIPPMPAAPAPGRGPGTPATAGTPADTERRTDVVPAPGAPGGATEPLVDPAGPTGATTRLRPAADVDGPDRPPSGAA